MTKSDLREKWSKYCDTDALVDKMMDLLSRYGHDNSEHGICVLLDTYFTEKEPLIKLIASSKNYIGDMRISTLQLFDRAIDSDDVYRAVTNFMNDINYKNFYKTTDGKGKTFFDYFVTGKTSYSLDTLPSAEEQKAMKEAVRKFDYNNFATRESVNKATDFCSYIDHFKYVNYSKMQNDFEYTAGRNGEKKLVIKAGTKTSRAFNQVCRHYGVDKFNPETVVTTKDGEQIEKTVYPYDKIFAAYADIVSELQRKLNFVISVNPLDYLTMSFGVNWRSCHHISGGGWKGGCLSYMLDNTSIITYVITDLNEPIHENPKIYRQMFHYDNGLFMQNRLYPQGNDGATNLYTKFRGFVVDEFNAILNENGEWSSEVGSDACRAHTESLGVHYRDYTGNSECSIFYPKSHYDKIREKIMKVGHDGVCVRCGGKLTSGSRLCHDRLRDCVFE
jgi:hypothetical protein